jgi:hypothetical protein
MKPRLGMRKGTEGEDFVIAVSTVSQLRNSM